MPRADATDGIMPRGLSREQAAHYIGIGTTFFDSLVQAGRMPRPRLLNSRKVWDRQELDIAFAALPHDGETEERNPFDGVAA